MGYQEINIPKGFSLFCATFNDVAKENIDLDSIQVYCDGVAVDEGSTQIVVIQKMKIDGTNAGYYDGTKMYTWRHYSRTAPTVLDKGLGWYVGTSNDRATGITLGKGEGISINNKYGKTIQLRVSGEVALQPVSQEIPTGFSLIGNMTPVELDLDDIQVCTNGAPIDLGSTQVAVIQKMKIDGTNAGYYDGTKMYTWRHYSRTAPTVLDKGLGWYVGTSNDRATNIKLAPGEAVSINNKYSKPLTLVYKSPVVPASAD